MFICMEAGSISRWGVKKLLEGIPGVGLNIVLGKAPMMLLDRYWGGNLAAVNLPPPSRVPPQTPYVPKYYMCIPNHNFNSH